MKLNIPKVGMSLLLFTILISGCDKQRPYSINQTETSSTQSEESTTQAEIFNIPYSIRSNMSLAIRMDDISKKYGKPDVVREEKNYTYEIRNLEDGSKFFVLYRKDKISSDMWRLKGLFDRNDFSKIEVKKSTDTDVKKIDPYFNVYELQGDKGISEHRLKNNGLAILEYKKEKNIWLVEKVEFKDQDPSGFESKLLLEDKNLLDGNVSK